MTDSHGTTNGGTGDAGDAESGEQQGNDELRTLIEEADNEHGEDGAAAMADHLRDRVDETTAEPEAPGEVED